MESVEKETEEWYRQYYLKTGKDRNDLLTNPEVLFQHLAFEDAVISALRKATGVSRESSRILDVGCGDGGSLARFLHLGFSPTNLYGIDVLGNRIDEASRRYPNLHFVCDDASSMPFDDGMFDLVLESTMFIQLTDEDLSQRIAEEMVRVAKPGGYLLLIDWRYGKPRNPDYLAVSVSRIGKMFSVGSSSDLICQTRGAMVPPVGRAVSKYLPSIYFLLRAMFPFLVGSKATLLQRR